MMKDFAEWLESVGKSPFCSDTCFDCEVSDRCGRYADEHGETPCQTAARILREKEEEEER